MSAPLPPITTDETKASGAKAADPSSASNDPENPHLVVPASKKNPSPLSCTVCCITKPPSPTVVEPEANNINLSLTNKFSVFLNEAVPSTVKS